MINLLSETIECLEEENLTVGDVLHIDTNDGWITWEEFKNLADESYNDGFGHAEVRQDVIVVGKDFWLSRWEYDGSEGWEFNRYPVKSEKEAKNITLFGDCWHD